jgi:ABC-type nitrate/sulfonate/bicarbonate transport system substrate-binding protein
MHVKRRVLGAVLALAVAMTAAACGGGDADAKDNGKGAPATVNFGIAGGENAYYAAHLAATQSGALTSALKSFSTSSKTTNFDSGPPLLAALASGDVSFMLLGASNVLGLNLKGQDVVGLATIAGGPQVVMVGAKKYESSRGTDVTAYDGAKWGFTAAGSQSAAADQAVVEAAGLDWSKQGQVAVGGVSAYTAALQSGQVDILAMDPLTAGKVIDQGIGYVVTNPQQAGGDFPFQASGMTLIAKKDFVDKYPDLTKAIVKAEIDGLKQVQAVADDPAQVLKLMPAEFVTANSADWATSWPLEAPGVDGIDGTFTDDGRKAAEGFARVQFAIPDSQKLDLDTLTNDYSS